MSLVLVVLGLLIAGYGATASVAARAASRLELTRWVARRLEGADAAAIALSRPGDIAAAGDALLAVGVTVAGVAAPWALDASGVGIALVAEVLLGVPLVAVTTYFLPRAIGRRWPEAVVRSVVPRLKPAGALVGRIVRGRAATARAELAALLRDGAAAGLAHEDELEIVTGVMTFADRVVREVMTPRTRIAAASEGASTAELAALFTSSGYTRLPVYRHSLDEIVGMVHAFDLIKAGPSGTVRPRPVAKIAAATRCADALVAMKRGGLHLAVVLDRFGGTAGLLTMEDLLEELVGEIFDEFDERAAPTPEHRGVLVVDAAYPLERLRERFGIPREAPERVQTVGGYLAWSAGRIPMQGERLLAGGLEFDVLEGTPTKLIKLVVRTSAPAPENPRRNPAEGGETR